MDANGTRFHLLLGRADWGRCSSEGRPLSEAWADSSGTGADVAWDAVRAEVSLRAELFRFPAAPRRRPPKLEDRRGAARDRYGNFYWIDRDGLTVKVMSSGSRATSTSGRWRLSGARARASAASARRRRRPLRRPRRWAGWPSPATTTSSWARWRRRPGCWCSTCTRAARR